MLLCEGDMALVVVWESEHGPSEQEANTLVTADKIEQMPECKPTMQACLQQFSQPETLSEEDSWFCPRCKAFRNVRRSGRLSTVFPHLSSNRKPRHCFVPIFVL